MSKIMVINAGSSSVKFSLFDNLVSIAQGIVEKIGHDDSRFDWRRGETEEKINLAAENHEQAIQIIMSKLLESKTLEDYTSIAAVGHRVVHGGKHFKEPVIIDDSVMAQIEACIPLAPLHNPHNLSGIVAMKKVLPNVQHVAVFDTAFHQTMPEHAFMYPLPYEYYEKHSVRRYGFHGTSHEYVCGKVAEYLSRPKESLNIITLHLGNGCSACAIKAGKSIDTTMGLTPLEGLMMGTRSGSIDPAIVFFLSGLGLELKDIDTMLNKKSGLLGVSGISNDMRDLYTSDNKRAWLAIDMFCYRVSKTVGAYMAALGSCDAVVFTGGIGENVKIARERIVAGLAAFDIRLDADKNDRSETTITSVDSKIPVLIIPTDEEKMIAMHSARLAGL